MKTKRWDRAHALALVLGALLGLAALSFTGCGGEAPADQGAAAVVTPTLVGTWGIMMPAGGRTWTFTASGLATYAGAGPTMTGAYTLGTQPDGTTTITWQDGSPDGQTFPYALMPCAGTQIPRPSTAVDCAELAGQGWFRTAP